MQHSLQSIPIPSSRPFHQVFVRQQREVCFDIDVLVFEDNLHKGVVNVYCPALHLATAGDSFIDAIYHFYDAYRGFVGVSKEMGSLQDQLRSMGWTYDGTHITPSDTGMGIQSAIEEAILTKDDKYDIISLPVSMVL